MSIHQGVGLERGRLLMNVSMRWGRGFTGATGLEPATSGLTGRRSNQLNYAPTQYNSLIQIKTSDHSTCIC